IIVFMCVELMLNAVNLSFVAFAQVYGVAGQIFVFFVMTVAAAEAAVGLAIIIALFRHRQTVNLRSEEHTSELQSLRHLVCRLLLHPPPLSTLFPYTTLFRSIIVFMCVELMLNAVNLSFVAFAQVYGVAGQIFVFFVMTVAAAEAAVGLAIIIALFRHRQTVNLRSEERRVGKECGLRSVRGRL